MQAISVTNGSTPTLVVAARLRWSVLIQNTSDTTIALKLNGSGEDLTVDNGFQLDAGGSILLEDFIGRGTYNHAIEAVHAAGAPKELRVQEFAK